MNIVDLSNIVYHPYNRDNLDVSGLNWYIISFDNLTNKGTYILEYKPGAKTPTHKHLGFEDFLILEGELINSSGDIFKKNQFISFIPKLNIIRILKLVVKS